MSNAREQLQQDLHQKALSTLAKHKKAAEEERKELIKAIELQKNETLTYIVENNIVGRPWTYYTGNVFLKKPHDCIVWSLARNVFATLHYRSETAYLTSEGDIIHEQQRTNRLTRPRHRAFHHDPKIIFKIKRPRKQIVDLNTVNTHDLQRLLESLQNLYSRTR